MTRDQENAMWATYPSDLLVGPLPHKLSPNGYWMPDYSHPGVARRIGVEVDFIEDVICGGRRH
jgi:hypothetical protein